MKINKFTYPEPYVTVNARLQHWNIKNIIEADLFYDKDETDLDWRTVDDKSEVSCDWDVIEWKYPNDTVWTTHRVEVWEQ